MTFEASYRCYSGVQMLVARPVTIETNRVWAMMYVVPVAFVAPVALVTDVAIVARRLLS